MGHEDLAERAVEGEGAGRPLPDHEREDLMEDLNEEGLSDYKQPGPEDFPLIMNRIAIIEQIAPYADQFMLPHLAEAYKDLVNLLKGYEAQ